MKYLNYALALVVVTAFWACEEDDAGNGTNAGTNNNYNGTNNPTTGTLEMRVTGDTNYSVTCNARYLRLGDTSITVSFDKGTSVSGSFTVYGDLINGTAFPHADSAGVTNPPAYLFTEQVNTKTYIGTSGTITKNSLGNKVFEGTIRHQNVLYHAGGGNFKQRQVEVDFAANSTF